MSAILEDWLIRTPQGWVEPTPPACACGCARFLIGWITCRCGGGPLDGGHRTWTCRDCGRSTNVGCRGFAGEGPMDGYGCAASDDQRAARARARERERHGRRR